MKELAFYNKLNNLEPISVQQIDNSPYSSVQDLMLKFVKDIQIDFPATVTTVLKTGDKIATNVTGQTCNLCKVKIINSILNSNVFLTINFRVL